ncbi:ribosomal protein S18-alanine N-acetyltransferase [Xylanimonas protaetiae]|uniref:Ribosomal-protein-alanine N-acetyltransferase n=1 Tax=Xylanimonas protaetiae TaxID=2509457 RepID=A0A4V0YG65_9MICO|nr:ribosomal protein S18-alanine N-acetyltransferase [Xylanimonas protaetiae]QAY70131.1 ribosomal-protein-alanine N-acetyltransferase [Xylanimonas protaetiae]
MTAAPVRLRPLRRDDFDRVLELERELFGPGAWTYGMLAEELAAWGRWYVVAEEVESEAVGRAAAGRGREAVLDRRGLHRVVGYAGLWFDGDVTQVMTVGVDPLTQRRGVGRALMDALVRRSRELGASAVFLEVRVDNEPALALYADLGFERLGVRKRYYQPENKDAYTMRLLLDEPGSAATPAERDAS